jgi:hypothetical protein
MTSENAREVYRALRAAQEKYIYFLLAAAGAAIALAVNQTQGLAMAWSQVPLAAGVLSWGLSFFFGCRHLAYVSSILYANAELLRVESGQHPHVGDHPQLMGAASEGIRQAIQSNSERANRLGHLQFRFLVAGGALYILWHVLEMYLRGVK